MQPVSSRFELVSPCPIPTTITITPQAPPSIMNVTSYKHQVHVSAIRSPFWRGPITWNRPLPVESSIKRWITWRINYNNRIKNIVASSQITSNFSSFTFPRWSSWLVLQNTLTTSLQRGKTLLMSVLDMTLNLMVWGSNLEYPFIAITPRFTLAQIGSTW